MTDTPTPTPEAVAELAQRLKGRALFLRNERQEVKSPELMEHAAAMLDAIAAARDAQTKRADDAEAEVKRLTGAIAVKGGNEHYPAEDAYLLACRAIETHRAKVTETLDLALGQKTQIDQLMALLKDAEAERDARLTQAAAKRLIMNAVPLAAKACRIADEGRDAAIARAEAAEAKVALLVAALKRWESHGCPDCSGDCASANPPVSCCIMRETRDAIAEVQG